MKLYKSRLFRFILIFGGVAQATSTEVIIKDGQSNPATNVSVTIANGRLHNYTDFPCIATIGSPEQDFVVFAANLRKGCKRNDIIVHNNIHKKIVTLACDVVNQDLCPQVNIGKGIQIGICRTAARIKYLTIDHSTKIATPEKITVELLYIQAYESIPISNSDICSVKVIKSVYVEFPEEHSYGLFGEEAMVACTDKMKTCFAKRFLFKNPVTCAGQGKELLFNADVKGGNGRSQMSEANFTEFARLAGEPLIRKEKSFRRETTPVRDVPSSQTPVTSESVTSESVTRRKDPRLIRGDEKDRTNTETLLVHLTESVTMAHSESASYVRPLSSTKWLYLLTALLGGLVLCLALSLLLRLYKHWHRKSNPSPAKMKYSTSEYSEEKYGPNYSEGRLIDPRINFGIVQHGRDIHKLWYLNCS